MNVFYILVFPGLVFLFVYGLIGEYIERKLYARLQNRIGPPWFQPLADIIKLMAKEEIIPCAAEESTFRAMPLLALATSVAAFMYIPIWGVNSLYSFTGDVIVVLYLLTIPTFALFLAGWYSRSVYASIGAVRTLTQLFAYEVPLFVTILAAALLSNTWSLSGMTIFYNSHPWLWLVNLVGFGVAFVSLLGKLEKTPFDIPEAETEIVAGTLTEYSGRMLGFFRTTMNVEMIVGTSLLAAVFMPFGYVADPYIGFLIYLAKTLFLMFMIALVHSTIARPRIDQMIALCWKILAPLAFLQLIANIIIKKFV